MAFDDLTLERPAAPSAPPPRQTPPVVRWVLVALAAVVASAALTFWWMSRAQPATTGPAPALATDVALGASRPKRQPMDLPALDESDGVVRSLVAALSHHPTLARLLATPSVVRGATLAVVQIGDGRTPVDPLKAIRPQARVEILGTVTGYIDPRSYERWNPIAAGLVSVAPADAAQLYVNVKPLFDRAYIELGHPDGDFDTAVVRALQMLNDTPVPAKQPMLLRRPGYFEHEDATLRSLVPVQKQLLLIGTENRRKVMDWLHQFAAALDLKVN